MDRAVTSRMFCPAHPDEQRLLLQPRALAGGAGHDVHVLFQFLPHLLRIGFPVAPLQIVQHPFEFLVVGVATAAVLLPPELHLFPAGAVEDDAPRLFGKLGKGRADIKGIGLGQRLQNLMEPAGEPLFPRGDRPFPR